MIPLQGDLLLVRDTDVLSLVIEGVTNSPYSHVAVFTGPEELVEAQGFRKVGYQDPETYAGKSDLFRCDALTEEQRQQIVATVKSHIGQHYDYVLIVIELIRYLFGLILPWYEHNTVICSTLVADAYRKAGIDPCPGIRYPSPADLANSKIFRKVESFEREIAAGLEPKSEDHF